MITLLMLYDFILILSIPFYLASLILKGKFSWEVLERFKKINESILKLIDNKPVIWLHAVSLGEVSTCKGLIKQLSLRHPKKIILITTITSTGKMLAQSISKNNIISLYMPLDFSFFIKSFIKRVKPKLLILIETELWPNLLYYTQREKIVTLVLNARLSDRSFRKYRLFRPLLKRLSAGIKMFCVQSQIDRDRFLSIGINSDKIKITGNMKFDAIKELDEQELLELTRLRDKILSQDTQNFLIVAGSTHKTEEEAMLDIFSQLKKEFSYLRLLIAPRHLERLESIEKMIKCKNMKPERISHIKVAREDTVLLLDTIGKLRLIYSLANLVFMGGSLVPIGGHNILEPAYFSKPILVGPYMHNFRAVTQLFLTKNALIQVGDCRQLASRIKELISDKKALTDLGVAAKSVLASNQGASITNLAIIEENLI